MAQPALAFEGNYQEASGGKNNIFLKLSKAVTNLKYDIKQKAANQDLLEDDRIKISLFRNLKFKMFFISMIADCIQAIVPFNVVKTKIAYTSDFAKEEIGVQEDRWAFFVDTVLTTLIAKLEDADINEYIDDKDKYTSVLTR